MRWISIGLLCFIILSSCANVLRFEKDALVAHAQRLDSSHELLYYSIRIDLTKRVDSHIMGSLLKFSTDSQPIAVQDLKPQLVAHYLKPFIPPPQWPNKLKEKMIGVDAYSGGGFFISFKNDQPLTVSICSHCENRRESPIVGSLDGKQFYT